MRWNLGVMTKGAKSLIMEIMKQTITIETTDNTVLQLLQNLAAMKLLTFTSETPTGEETRSATNFQNDLITARLNEIYSELDSSIDPFVVAAQAEVLEGDNW